MGRADGGAGGILLPRAWPRSRTRWHPWGRSQTEESQQLRRFGRAVCSFQRSPPFWMRNFVFVEADLVLFLSSWV